MAVPEERTSIPSEGSKASLASKMETSGSVKKKSKSLSEKKKRSSFKKDSNKAPPLTKSSNAPDPPGARASNLPNDKANQTLKMKKEALAKKSSSKSKLPKHGNEKPSATLTTLKLRDEKTSNSLFEPDTKETKAPAYVPIKTDDGRNDKESEEESPSYLSNSTLGRDDALRAYAFAHVSDSLTKMNRGNGKEQQQDYYETLLEQQPTRKLDDHEDTSTTMVDDDTSSSSIYKSQSSEKALQVSLVDESKGSSLHSSIVNNDQDQIEFQYQSESGVIRKTVRFNEQPQDSKPKGPLKSALSSGKKKTKTRTGQATLKEEDSDSRNICFSDVTVHYHGVVLGDCPFTQAGPPIARGWNPVGEPDHYETLEDYEAQFPKTNQDTRSSVRFLTAAERYQMLQAAGYTHSEMLRTLQTIRTLQAEMTDPHDPRISCGATPLFLRCLVPKRRRGVQKKNSMLLGSGNDRVPANS